MVGPLAGPEVRALALALGRALPEGLPAKFGCLVDGGGPLSIAGERADIALCVTSEGVAVRVDGEWLGVTTLDHARGRCLRRAEARLTKMTVMPAPGRRRLGRLGRFTGLAAPFGRIEAAQLRRPGRAVREGRRVGNPAFALACAVCRRGGRSVTGFIVDDNDPLLRIEACPGAPACASATVDTRADARRLAAIGFAGTSTSPAAPRAARGRRRPISCWSARTAATAWCATARRAIRSARAIAPDDLATLLDA